jgi:ribosomal protein L37AE/L43A
VPSEEPPDAAGAEEPRVHVIETASSGRARCRGCGQKIGKGALRFGEKLENPFADGEMTHWFHLDCAAFKRPQPLLETLERRKARLENQESLEAEARKGLEHRRLPRVNGAERASSGRASCRACRETIAKGSWRIPLVYWEEGRFAPSGFVHARCTEAYLATADVAARVRRFSPGLTEDDLRELEAELQSPGG